MRRSGAISLGVALICCAAFILILSLGTILLNMMLILCLLYIFFIGRLISEV